MRWAFYTFILDHGLDQAYFNLLQKYKGLEKAPYISKLLARPERFELPTHGFVVQSGGF